MSHNKHVQDIYEVDNLDTLVDAVKADVPQPEACLAAQTALLTRLQHKCSKESSLMTLIRSITSRKRMGLAVATLALAVVAVVMVSPFGNSPARAYAAVVKQLRDVVTLSFKAESKGANTPQNTIWMLFRKPGLQRLEMQYGSSRMIQICDTNRREGLVLMPETSTSLKLSLDNMPSADKARLELAELFSTTLKGLPEKADAIETGEMLGNRKLAGFRVGKMIYWVELETEKLIKVEMRSGDSATIFSDFEFDPQGVDERMFSLEVPAGYKTISTQNAQINAAEGKETDLVEYLRLCSGMIKGQLFPATTNPMEVLALQKEGKLVDNRGASDAERQQFVQAFSQASAASFTFVWSMKPENDWHYNGKGVAQGQQGTAIAWWKPTGANHYRILWADLTLTDGDPPTNQSK